jgi:hypothetical protein
MNLALRIIGLAAAGVVLCCGAVIPQVLWVSLFLGSFTLHFGADLAGDDLFLDEPLGVALTRWFGYSLAAGITVASYLSQISLEALVLFFIASLGIHLTGDALSVAKDKFNMDFLSGFVLYNFLGWFGLAGAELTLVLSNAGKVAKGIGTFLFLVAVTGFYASYRIYTDGNDTAAHEPPPAPKAA